MEFFKDPEFWVAVAFVIGVGLMWWKGASAVSGMLDARAVKIKEELDEANRLREEAAAALAEYQRRQRDALNEAKEIADRAREAAERMAAEAAVDLETTIKRREELAKERIAQAEAAALAEVRAAAVEVAIAATRQLIREQLDEKNGALLIDEAIKVLPQQLH